MTKEIDDWKPGPQDIEWMRKYINKIVDGGKWVIPAANYSEITIYHSTKTYDAIIKDTDPNGIATMMWTLTVLKEIGYLGNKIIFTNGIDYPTMDVKKFQEDNA